MKIIKIAPIKIKNMNNWILLKENNLLIISLILKVNVGVECKDNGKKCKG